MGGLDAEQREALAQESRCQGVKDMELLIAVLSCRPTPYMGNIKFHW